MIAPEKRLKSNNLPILPKKLAEDHEQKQAYHDQGRELPPIDIHGSPLFRTSDAES
jgi:hypothetical protein